MSEETPLDRAMKLAGGDASDGRAVDALTSAELYLLLEAPPSGDRMRPSLLVLEAGPTALAFDTEARLAAFAQGEAPYIAMQGRDLAGMLASQDLNLAVNAGVAPSELFHEAAALRWMVQALAETASEDASVRLEALGAPRTAPEALISALDARLAALGGLASEAWLASARRADGGETLALAVTQRIPGDAARRAISEAVARTVRLAAPDGPPVAVAFCEEGDALQQAARRVGLGFELPTVLTQEEPAVPGMDPERPPRLR